MKIKNKEISNGKATIFAPTNIEDPQHQLNQPRSHTLNPTWSAMKSSFSLLDWIHFRCSYKLITSYHYCATHHFHPLVRFSSAPPFLGKILSFLAFLMQDLYFPETRGKKINQGIKNTNLSTIYYFSK